LKGQLIGNDTRSALVDYLAKGALGGVQPSLPSAAVAKIDAVTAESVAAVAKKVFSSKPTIAVLGDVENTPSSEKIQAAFK
jgi:predicted Zn-dependent peptidase